jgi:hypothetical protein
VYFGRFCKIPASWRILYKDGEAPFPAYSVDKVNFNTATFPSLTTSAVWLEAKPQTRHYQPGEIGPLGAMFLDHDIDWREFGIIEWQVK